MGDELEGSESTRVTAFYNSAVRRRDTRGVGSVGFLSSQPQKGTWHGKAKEEEKVSVQVHRERRWKCFAEKARLTICQRVNSRPHLRSLWRLLIYFTVQVHSHPVPNSEITGF